MEHARSHKFWRILLSQFDRHKDGCVSLTADYDTMISDRPNCLGRVDAL